MDKIFNLVGLFMNFTGTLLLWKFVVPSPIEIKKNVVMVIDTETVGRVIKLQTKYRTLSGIGLTLIASGFLLQLTALIW